jgi:Flp pilus assembly protein TadD
MNRGDYQDAALIFEKANQIARTRTGYCMLGVSLSRLGRKDEAEASYREALSVDPQFDEAYYNLGVLLADSNPTAAAELFCKALSLDPNYAQAHRELGWLLRNQDRDAESEAHVRRAIELQPDDPWAHIYLGNLLLSKGDVTQAEAEFRWAHESAPESAVPLWALAQRFENRKEWVQAKILYERALAGC